MDKLPVSFYSVVNKIVKKECLTKNLCIPSDQLIRTIIDLLFTTKVWNSSDLESKKFSNSVVSSVLNFFEPSKQASLATVKLQMFFARTHLSKEEVLEKHQTLLLNSTRNLLKLILDKHVKTKEDSDQLYHHISSFIILCSGLGDPTNVEAIKETSVALKSVLSSKELPRFATKHAALKEKQILNICEVVTGIRVYNKDCNKSLDDVYDVPTALENAMIKCYNFLEQKASKIEVNVSELSRIFFDDSVDRSFGCSDDLQDDFSNYEYIKSFIILEQQYLTHLRILIQENRLLNEELKSCLKNLQHKLARIHQTIKYRTAIPVVEIYPQFTDISLCWNKIRELKVLLNSLADVSLQIFNIFEEISVPTIDSKPETSRQRSDIFEYPEISSKENCQLFTSDNTKHLYNMKLQYDGFCIVSFVEKRGLLVRGIKDYGVIQFSEMYYCFSSIEAMHKFCQKPEWFIKQCLKTVEDWPEAIPLLQLMNNCQDIGKKSTELKEIDKKRTTDVCIQTDVHFPTMTVVSNERNLLQICEQISKMNTISHDTRSSQTILSAFRVDAETQTNKGMEKNVIKKV